MSKDAKISDVPGLVRPITPNLPTQAMRLINAVLDVHDDEPPLQLADRLRKISNKWQNEGWSLEFRATALVLADLLEQGWKVSPVGREIELRPPGTRLEGESRDEARNRLRTGLQAHRKRQLDEPGTVAFLKRMQRPVVRGGRRTSIADLIDDGSTLVPALRRCQLLTSEAALSELEKIIQPVVQVCDGDRRCEITGLRLVDIWRYFRHTWSNEYRPIPGRTMQLLIRNSARPNWPVMGIAMLASPVVRLRSRDAWIGWIPEIFIKRLKSGSDNWDAKQALTTLHNRICESLREVRTDDFNLSAEDLENPSFQTVLRMEARAAGAAHGRRRELRDEYDLMVEAGEQIRSQRDPVKNGDTRNVDWQLYSEDLLFIHKRADLISKLLFAKRFFRAIDLSKPLSGILFDVERSQGGERAIGIALTEMRKFGLSSQVVDLSVCGAVSPYNELIAGKLVALLMASEEVRSFYRDRYSKKISLISSQMAGRPIMRNAELKVITTTSLYGFGSVQYNGLKLRASDHIELPNDVWWRELQKTTGFGTYHLSSETSRTLRLVAEREHGARRVNNRFGEGASPRLRLTREGLEALGIDPTQVMHHATPRVFYACELYPGAAEALMGLGDPGSPVGPSAVAIATAWRRRWLVRRIQQPGVLERLEKLNADSVRNELRVPDLNGQLPLGI